MHRACEETPIRASICGDYPSEWYVIELKGDLGPNGNKYFEVTIRQYRSLGTDQEPERKIKMSSGMDPACKDPEYHGWQRLDEFLKECGSEFKHQELVQCAREALAKVMAGDACEEYGVEGAFSDPALIKIKKGKITRVA